MINYPCFTQANKRATGEVNFKIRNIENDSYYETPLSEVSYNLIPESWPYGILRRRYHFIFRSDVTSHIVEVNFYIAKLPC